MAGPKTHDDRPKVVEQLPELADAAAILGLDDIHEQWVDVPEWNVRARVVALTGAERDDLELAMVERRGKSREINLRNLRARIVAASVRKPDDRDRTVFSASQVDALGRKSAAALQRLFAVARELSGLSDDDVEELTDEMGKDQSSASGTA
jgi:hypothetical protein